MTPRLTTAVAPEGPETRPLALPAARRTAAAAVHGRRAEALERETPRPATRVKAGKRTAVRATQVRRPADGDGKHAHLNGGRGLAATGGGYEPGWTSAANANPAATKALWDSNLDCHASLRTWTPNPGADETRPINCVNWYELFAFCIWDGGFLPSEAEWNYAAAGGAEQRVYPWGSAAPDPTHASYSETSGCWGDGAPGCTVADLVHVGTKPAGDGRYGQAELAGNVWEWTVDAFAGANYASADCSDCADVTSGARVIRGGSFDMREVRSSPRIGEQSARWHNHGGRCARAP